MNTLLKKVQSRARSLPEPSRYVSANLHEMSTEEIIAEAMKYEINNVVKGLSLSDRISSVASLFYMWVNDTTWYHKSLINNRVEVNG